MTARVLLLLVCAAGLSGADDLRLSASCDDQGNLILHGEGPFGSGETVEIRLLRCVGTSREYKAGRQVASAARSFDAVLEPGDLPTGEYVVEVRVAGLAAAVGVNLSSLRAVEIARGEELEVLLGLYRKVQTESKKLGEALSAVDEETRASRLRTWEKGALALGKDIDRRDVTQLVSARQVLSEGVGLLVILARVHRGVADQEMGDLLKKHMVLHDDATPKEVSEVLETCRKNFAGALAESFTTVMRKSVEELDRTWSRAQGKKKEADKFRSNAAAWASRVSKSCDQEKAGVAPDGPLSTEIVEEIGRLRAAMRELADTYIQTFDRDQGPAALNRIVAVQGRVEACLTQIAERARQ